jgi:tetratricopeptide (TPR) repeat protein
MELHLRQVYQKDQGVMTNWLPRVILFIVAGAGCVGALHYATGHFKPERQIILLNRTRPDFHDLLHFEKQETSELLSRQSLKEYFDYFRLVTEAMPQNSDGNLMLGYLYQITGQPLRAGAYLKEAHRLEERFFFTEFNLGVLFYEQGQYAQSAEYLKQALAIPPQETLGRMMTSVVYRQILASSEDSADLVAGLRQAYHDAYIILELDLQGARVDTKIHAHIV